MEKDQPIRSISRALQVLQTINRLRTPTLMEIARETNLPYPTTFRIVQTLIHEGVIEQEPFRQAIAQRNWCNRFHRAFRTMTG